ncbi:hypothetical protein Taro_030582 [Colocasia esculenta]|uniref:B box-type domain-containing protein n=1 Tax=Colocasia esculenta TaxID=4460 RepID=A0A843VGP1_COLES|nr:hypothetical protein [Colocasia esculenta]
MDGPDRFQFSLVPPPSASLKHKKLLSLSLYTPKYLSPPPERFSRRLFFPKMVRETKSAPSWVGLLLARTFFELCNNHKELRKSEVNIFCIECSESLCHHCLFSPTSQQRGRHDFHHRLQIRRYVYQDVIRVHDMQKYVDCSKVQSFIVNGSRVVLLNPKRQTKPATPGNNAGPLCGICQRAVPEPNRYCSIACKVSDPDVGSGSDPEGSGPVLPPPASEADESPSPKAVPGGETSSSSSRPSVTNSPEAPAEKPPLKRKGVGRRKGLPRRAQFF